MKPRATVDYEAQIIYQLARVSVPMSMGWIAEELGVKRGRGGRYSKTNYRKYDLVGRALQVLKRAGSVEYIGGRSAGWKITKRGRGL